MYKIVAVILGSVFLALAWVKGASAAFHGPVVDTDKMLCFVYDSDQDIVDLIETFEKDPNVLVLEVFIPFQTYDGRMEILTQGDGFQNYNWVTWKQGMLCEVIKETIKTEDH